LLLAMLSSSFAANRLAERVQKYRLRFGSGTLECRQKALKQEKTRHGALTPSPENFGRRTPMAEPTVASDAAPIRVLIADKTRMNTQLLAHSLGQDGRFEVVEADPPEDAILAAVSSTKPDVVLLSPVLEEDSALGLRLARQIRGLHPEMRVVMLLDASERESVVEAFRAGVRGVFCRTEAMETLAKCITCAHRGQVWANSQELEYLLEALSEAMSMRSADNDLSLLTKRERDVVLCVAEGLSNREIAHRLKLTEHTVKNYLFRVFDKLGVSSRVEVVLYAFKLVRSSKADAQVSVPAADAKPSASTARQNRRRR
jgi:DNA-binding NarL/FixJ family response regulator